MKVLNKIADWVANITLALACFALGSVMCVVLAQVILRFFDTGIRWSDTYCRYMTIWAVALGSNYLIRRQDLLTSNFFEHLFPKWFLAIRDYLYIIVFSVLFVILTKQGWIQAVQNKVQNINALPTTMFTAYVAIPVGTGLMLFQYIVYTINKLVSQLTKKGDAAE